MAGFVCMHCGGNEVVREEDLYICKSCKSKYKSEDVAAGRTFGEFLLSMSRYRNRMIKSVVEIKLYPQRAANIEKMISECKFYETEKKTDLEILLSDLEKNRKKTEDSVDEIKKDAYLLMKRHASNPPARDIWESTFERVVTEYVERCYLDKSAPDQEDKADLNVKLFPIGFGYGYYSQSGLIDETAVEKCNRVFNIPRDPIEEFEERGNYTEKSKANLKEYILALFLLGSAIAVFVHFIMNDPYGNPFDITGMGILGGIGLIAAALCMAFEGGFPVSIKGLLACSVFLVLAMEFPITTPLLIFLYIVCIYSLAVSYGGRWSGVALGTVAILCLPFWGVVLFIFIGMLFGGGSRRSNSSRKNKK